MCVYSHSYLIWCYIKLDWMIIYLLTRLREQSCLVEHSKNTVQITSSLCPVSTLYGNLTTSYAFLRVRFRTSTSQNMHRTKMNVSQLVRFPKRAFLPKCTSKNEVPTFQNESFPKWACFKISIKLWYLTPENP